MAQLVGLAEYTDCIAAGGKTSAKNVLDMTRNNRMVRLQ